MTTTFGKKEKMMKSFHGFHLSFSIAAVALIMVVGPELVRAETTESSTIFVTVESQSNNVPDGEDRLLDVILDRIAGSLVKKGARVVIDAETLKRYAEALDAHPRNSDAVSYLRRCIAANVILPSTNTVTPLFFIGHGDLVNLPVQTQETTKTNVTLTYSIRGWKSAVYGQMKKPLNALDAIMIIKRRGGKEIQWQIPAELPDQVAPAEDDILINRSFEVWFVTAAKRIVTGDIPEKWEP